MSVYPSVAWAYMEEPNDDAYMAAHRDAMSDEEDSYQAWCDEQAHADTRDRYGILYPECEACEASMVKNGFAPHCQRE